MTIERPGWFTPALLLHGWIFLAALWPLPVAVVGFLPEDSLKMLALSALLLIPVVFSHFLIRWTRKLWSYLLVSLLLIPVMGYLAASLADLWKIAGAPLNAELSVSLMFADGVPHQAAVILSGLMAMIFTAVCMMIRGSVRIRKGQLIKAYEEMEGGGGTSINIEDWELNTVLDSPSVIQWIYYTVIYGACVALNVESSYRMLFWLLFVDAFLWLLCNHADRLYFYMKDHQKIANLPVETMRRVSRIVMIAAVLVLLGFALPSVFYGKEPLAGKLQELPEQETTGEMILPEAAIAPSGGGPDQEMMEYLESIEPIQWPIWFQAAVQIFLYGILLFVLWLILKEILTGIRQMSAAFSRETEDEVVFLEKKAKDESVSIRRERGDLDLRGTPNQKVRKLYKKMIRKASKRIPGRGEAPVEIEKNSGFSDKEGSRLVHILYEKARYSREGCDSVDVEQMQKLRERFSRH